MIRGRGGDEKISQNYKLHAFGAGLGMFPPRNWKHIKFSRGKHLVGSRCYYMFRPTELEGVERGGHEGQGTPDSPHTSPFYVCHAPTNPAGGDPLTPVVVGTPL